MECPVVALQHCNWVVVASITGSEGHVLHIQLLEYPIPPRPRARHNNHPWWYLGNQERYHRSADVKTTRLLSLDKFYHFIFISNSFDPKFTRLNRMMVFWEAGKSCRWAYYDVRLIIKWAYQVGLIIKFDRTEPLSKPIRARQVRWGWASRASETYFHTRLIPQCLPHEKQVRVRSSRQTSNSNFLSILPAAEESWGWIRKQ